MVAHEPEKFRYYYRIMHRSGELGTVTSEFARDYLHRQLGMNKFAILVENAVWTGAIRAAWEQTIDATPGMQLVFADTFSSETRDFLPIFTRLKASGAEYILDASSKVEATHYLKQWAAVQGPSIGAIPTGVGTRKYYQEVGDQGISVCSVSTIPDPVNEATPKSADWWRRYETRYGDPEYTSGYSYDAVHILKEALVRSGSTEPDALVAALEQTDYLGVAARWAFEKDHHPRYGPGYRTIPIIQYYEPGPRGYRVIWPPDRAQGEFVYPAWRSHPNG
jgi:branched-chain amino acid transport system substrate-binding protein